MKSIVNRAVNMYIPFEFNRSSNRDLIRGKKIQIALKAGYHRPASETPFKWRFAGGPMMAQH